MKIKLTHAISEKVAKAVKAAVDHCIEKNQMSEIFEVSDIKGKVAVAHAGQLSLSGGSNTYQYGVTLFNNIVLVAGAAYVKHAGFDQSIERNVMSAIGSMMQMESGTGVMTSRIQNAVIQAMSNPSTEVLFELDGEMVIAMSYHSSPEGHSFIATVFVNNIEIASYKNRGIDQASVAPTATGIFNVLVHHAITFHPSKEREFFITEFTSFRNPGMLFGGPAGMPLAMTNHHPGGDGTFGGRNPGYYAGMNTNDPFSHF